MGLLVLGLLSGSFVNALAWRLHEREALKADRSEEAAARLRALSIVRGRSMCPHCRHELASRDLVPVLSWLLLRGRCRHCGHRIDDSPLVELAVPLAFLLCYAAWPYRLQGLGLVQFVVWLPFVVGLTALALSGFRWHALPRAIVLPVVVLAAVEVLLAVALPR